jgi:NADPH2:quinone reductase
MRCVVYTGTGGREVVAIAERPDPVAGKFEVLVATRFAGLNPADVLQREARHPHQPGSPADIPGIEVAGTVVACGEAVTRWQEGDRVFGLVGGGGLADRVVAHEAHLARVPDTLDDREAAAVPEAFITAHDALVTRGRFVPGETVAVLGANGGVGTAAVQIAHALGGRVLAGVRSEQLRDRVAELGADEVDAPAAVLERGGIDVVLELAAQAEHVALALAGLAPNGRIVVVSGRPGAETAFAVRDLMARRATLVGTQLRPRPPEEKALIVTAFARSVVPMLADGRARPVIDRVYPLEEAADALDAIRAPGKLGKLLLATA